MADKKETPALTEERVKAMIVEATAGIGKVIAEATKHLITADQVREIVAEAQNKMFEHVNTATLETITSSALAEPTLDLEWLKGLAFRGSKQGTTVVDGRPKLTAQPFERPLQSDDVLSFRVDGGQAIIVAADGRKHTVEI